MKTTLKILTLTICWLGFWCGYVEGQSIPDTRLGKGAITQIAYSPDGTLLAVADDSSRVWLYETKTFTVVGVLQGHTRSVETIAFSPDGKLLASGSVDKTVRLWDVEKREEVVILKGHTSRVKAVAFSPDGKLLASGGAGPDNTVRLWDVAQRQETAILAHKAGVYTVAFDPAGVLLASGSVDKTIRLWNVTQRKEIALLEGHTATVNSVAFSVGEKELASGSSDKTVRIWSVEEQKQVALLEGHKEPVNTVAFSPDGTLLVSGSNDKTVRLWDVAQRKEVEVLQRHYDAVRTVAFSPDGRQFASGASNGTVFVWGVAQRQVITALKHSSIGMLLFGTIYSPALEGNLIGDPATRPYGIYLPPTYETSNKRYPVIYVLHGYGGNEKSLAENIKNVNDQMLQQGKIKEMIAVFVDGSNKFLGSQYHSSVTIGDYEMYITKDLVNHIDANYRTITDRNSRGITGFSDGGDGSLHLAMKFPEIFSVVVAQGIAGSLDIDLFKEWALRTASANPQDWDALGELDSSIRYMFSWAAVVVPNPNKPPFFLDNFAELVNGEAQLVPELWQRFVEQDHMHSLERYLTQSVRLKGIKFVNGKGDPYNPVEVVRAFDKKLTDLGIEHVYIEHGGGHDFLPEESLSFLSERLSFEVLTEIVNTVDIAHTPSTFTLSQNYPNPFNPVTTITYDLPQASNMTLAIHSVSGQKVTTLVSGHQEVGHYRVMWDGRDTSGRSVASGVYLYRLEAIDRGFVATRRMLLVR